jgi:hypothetical protein
MPRPVRSGKSALSVTTCRVWSPWREGTLTAGELAGVGDELEDDLRRRPDVDLPVNARDGSANACGGAFTPCRAG